MGLKQIWVIDDSVSWFCENHLEIENNRHSGTETSIEFERMFSSFECLVQSLHDHSIAAISPAVFQKHVDKMKEEYTYKSPHACVLLNIARISEKQINYRPELRFMEDEVFAAECLKNKLTVCRWNRIALYDKPWKTTCV